MRLIYGSSLPPGLEAATKGELRIRVEKLILDDRAVNENPLINFSVRRTYRASRDVSNDVLHKSNRITVPVDHCAVSPLLWGEVHPSSQCVPPTPQQSKRGPTILVYPIKVREESFRAYLANMDSSPHHGMQLEVFVPSSYSGRPCLSVGKTVVPLGGLYPSKHIRGWFTVAHFRQQTMGSTEGSFSSATDAGRTDLPMADGVPIGKMKIDVSIVYLSLSPSREHKTRNGRAHKMSGTVGFVPPTDEQKPDRVGQRITSSTEEEVLASKIDAVAQTDEKQRLGCRDASLRSHEETADVPVVFQTENQRTAVINELLKKGLRLREQIRSASGRDDEMAVPSTCLTTTRHSSPTPSPGTLEGQTTGADGDDETVYTSECSDDEEAAIQEQKDDKRRRERVPVTPANRLHHDHQTEVSCLRKSHTTSDEERLLHHKHTSSLIPRVRRRGATDSATQNAVIELLFSNISFSTTAATADLHEMRINVRLSKDITTEEPASGPFSSYVHQVPLAQLSICLTFPVRSYSEESSRLVIEFYKVQSQPRLCMDTSAMPPSTSTAPREVVSENLLGLCIVGLFEQSREIVLRDPVDNLSNVFAHLTVQVINSSRPVPTGGMDGTLHAERKNRNVGLNISGALGKTPKLEMREDTIENTYEDADSEKLSGSTEEPNSLNASHLLVGPPVTGLDHHLVTHSDNSEKKVRWCHSSAERVVRHPDPLPAALSCQRVGNRVRRVRISILGAKHVPLVEVQCADEPLARRHGRSSSLSSNFHENFKAPNSFFVVEEIFCGSGRSASDVVPVAGWQTVMVRGGHYDRTAVVKRSQNPEYNYECVVYLQDDIPGATQQEGTAVPSHHLTESFSLQELQLTLWHCVQEGDEGYTPQSANQDDEEHFWANAMWMGEARIDLRSLRYLSRLDGYYKVSRASSHHGRAPPVACVPTPSSSNAIAYVRACVSLC